MKINKITQQINILQEKLRLEQLKVAKAEKLKLEKAKRPKAPKPEKFKLTNTTIEKIKKDTEPRKNQKIKSLVMFSTGDVFYNSMEDYFGVVSWINKSGAWFFKKKGQSSSQVADFTAYEVKWLTGYMHERQKDRYKKLCESFGGI